MAKKKITDKPQVASEVSAEIDTYPKVWPTDHVPHWIIALAGLISAVGTVLTIVGAYAQITWLLVVGIPVILIGPLVYLVAGRKAQPKALRTPVQEGNRYVIVIAAWACVVMAIMILVPKCAISSFDRAYESGLGRGKESVRVEIAANNALPPLSNATRQLPDGRILFTDLIPAHLDAIFDDDNHTNAEALRLMEPYFGKWIVFTGPVKDLYNQQKRSILFVGPSNPHKKLIGANFLDEKQIDRIQPLRNGDPVTCLCEITRSTKNSYTFWDCELQNP